MVDDPHKVVLIGESGVGKSCIIAQFINKSFSESTISSLTAQFIKKKLKISDGKELTFDIWDTAGQEQHRAIARMYYSDAKAVILVYDITNKKSFEEIKNYWYLQVVEKGASDVIFALAANKSDLFQERAVTDEEGKKFAEEIGAIFSETSAKNDSGINELFEHIGKKIIDPSYDYIAAEKNKKMEYMNKKKEEKKKEEKQKEERKKGVKLNDPKAQNEQKNGKKKCC